MLVIHCTSLALDPFNSYQIPHKPVSQCVIVKETDPGGSLDNQTWQTKWKTAPLAKVQLCEYENQNSGAFVVACSHLCAKFHCPVGKQNFSLLATVHESYWFVVIFWMRIAFRKTVVGGD